MDLSAVITWVGLWLSAVELHALWLMCTCQLDLARVSEFLVNREILDTGHHTTNLRHNELTSAESDAGAIKINPFLTIPHMSGPES